MKVTIGSGNVTKVTVNTGANVVFAPATDRSPAAAITIGTGGGGGADVTLAYNQANAAYNVANAAANTVRVSANGASTLTKANGINFVNTAAIVVLVEPGIDGNANVSFTTGAAAVGDAYNQANAARNQANTARNQANAAYSEANLKLNIAGGTITGNLTVSGNLEVLGNSTILNVETLSVEDNEIILNSNVTGAPALNAFITINRGTSPNVSLKWNEDNDQWQFTDDGNNFYSLNTALVSYAQANNARDQANTARDTANGAYGQANGAYAQANGAYAQANGAYNQANGAYAQANGAYAQANGAYSQANLSYAQANAAYSQANAAYDNANTRVLRAGDTMTGDLNVAATLITQNIIPSANLTYNLGNTTNRFNDLYISGNSVFIGDAVLSTNADSVTTNTFTAAVSFLNGGLNVLNQANSAYDAANSASSIAINAYGQANAARNQANAAYNEANLKLNLTGGTINGSLNISGNLTITGNSTFINVSTYVVDDPLIYLAANNNLTDLVDIGFVGAKNTGGTYSHTGLARDAGDATWYLFDNLPDSGHENNVIDFANTTLATLRANINANSILLVGNAVATQANLTLAHNQANTARDQANSARDQANTGYAQANAAYGQANSARDQANTARTTANDAYAQANTARTTANDAYGQANTARTTANDAYGQANSARGQANSAYGQANLAYAQANAAYSDSNTRVLKAGDTMTGALTITTSGIGLTVANANVTGNLNVGTQIVTSGSSGDISGVNTIYASTFTSGTINVTAQAANAYDQANNARNQANTAYGQGNSAYGQANTARTTANDSYGQANSARDQANTARNTANDAYSQANSSYTVANSAANTVRVSQNGSSTLSAKQLNFVNTSSIVAIVTDALDGNANIEFATTGASAADAYNQANAARNQANTARDQANTARTTANDAYDEANSKLDLIGGTITGNLIITGNLEVLGNSTTLNVETLVVEDNEIILNGNVAGSPTLNAFISVNRGSSPTVNLKWNEANDKWEWTDDGSSYYTLETSLNAYAQANSARDQANTARNTGNSAYGQANAAYDAANNASVRVSANSGTSIAVQNLVFNNTATVTVSVTQNGSNANVAFDSLGGSIESVYNTTTTSIETVDTFSKTTYRSAKYQMQVENLYGFAALEIMILHDGATTNLVEFGKATFGSSVGTFSSDISGNDVRLRFTATDDTSTLSYYKSLLKLRGSESLPTDLMTGTNIYDLMLVIPISPTDLNA